MEQKHVAVLYGGFSGERVISEKSAAVVVRYLDQKRYQSTLVDVTREGWYAMVDNQRLPLDLTDFSYAGTEGKVKFDGVFNAIHGTPGEDGKIQGYFDLIQIPYNNCGVLASSLSFDKAACNRYLETFGIKVATSYIARVGASINEDEILARVGLPCFVKPNDGGSSIGVTKVKHTEQLAEAIQHAQSDGVDALIETFLDGVEVSCGCYMRDGKPVPLAVTEIVPANEFFDFDSKYLDEGTEEITPARIDQEIYDRVMELTVEIYDYLRCSGMIRIDFMIVKGELFVIEVNTTPGISEASIIPRQVKYLGWTLEEFFTESVNEMFARQSAVAQKVG